MWIEQRVAEPLLPLRVILHGVRGGAFLVQSIVGAIMIGSMLYPTFHFQIVMGMSPLISGLANVATTAVVLVLVPFVTKVLNTYGPRPLMIAGPLFSAAGLFYLGGISADGGYVVDILPALVPLGIGLAMLFVPLQNLALIGVEPQDAGVASATVNSTFHIGGSIGLAIFTVIYAGSVDRAIEKGASELDAFTGGYSATFIASGIVMLIASAISFGLMRGTQEDLMPAWSEEDLSAY
ncbi:MFS transporter [Rhodococcus sp. IEGM1428]|uniref:MFS transporter n=1 Tax=Rhodococcus sp. IEGM1428 TaxID=3392191 RepID=UPI003D09C742